MPRRGFRKPPAEPVVMTFRLFKLNRMDKVAVLDTEFECREVPMPDLSNERIFPDGIMVKALFAPEVKWRLVEEFGPHCYVETEEGKLLFSADYTDMENLLVWILTFGEKVEVLEPKEVRENLLKVAETMRITYGGKDK
ncbi:MAG: WYL domain-containing protein [Lachnospiraceae bacterium]|nr:WYL domain-containing protein [Lachnospiraceae bacterium]